MRYLAAIPLALLVTPATIALEAPLSRLALSQEQPKSNGDFRDFMSGLEYYNGWGETAQDYLQAKIFFEMAARGGHTQAQHYLGLMYYKGLGVEKDNIEAYKWFDLAAASGDKVGVVLKITLKEILTAEEVSEAESRKEEWLHAGILP